MLMLEHALALAGRGFRVHPLHDTTKGVCSCGKGSCPPKTWGKHPRLGAWPKMASADIATITDWWRKWPGANVGIACGAGLYVVDVDPANGGTLEPFGELQPTLTVRTATGGLHLYYAVTEPYRNTANAIAQGIDTRGVGGYVVGPGSVRLEGSYEIVTDVPPAPLPAVFVPKQQSKPPSKPEAVVAEARTAPALRLAGGTDILRRARAYLATIPGAIEGQGGSTDTLVAAIKVGPGFDLDPGDALSVLTEWSNNACLPPWSEQELRHKIDDAYKVTANRGWLLERKAPIKDPEGLPPGATSVQLEAHGPSLANCCRVLEDQRLRQLALGTGTLRFNEMTQSPEFNGSPVDDALEVEFRRNAERRIFGTEFKTQDRKTVCFGAETVEHAFLVTSRINRYHPVREYLQRCPKGVGDPIGAVCDALNIRNNVELSRDLIRRWAIGCVARVMQPGCQLDQVLVLVNRKQGVGKSRFFRALAGQWFGEGEVDPNSKDSVLALHHCWIYEWGELKGIPSGGSWTALKSFISRPIDTVRPPYGHTTLQLKRSSVIVGTSNDDAFLSDPTGNRRFWPIPVGDIDLPRVVALRDAFWGHARDLLEAGEPYWLDSEAVLAPIHEQVTAHDAWEGPISAWLENAAEPVIIARVLSEALGIRLGDHGRWEQMRAADVLKRLGWSKQSRVRHPVWGRVVPWLPPKRG